MADELTTALINAQKEGEVADLSSLGPFSEIGPQIAALAQTPIAPLASAALAQALSVEPDGPWAEPAADFTRQLSGQHSLLALADTVDILLGESPLASVVAVSLHKTMLRGLDSLLYDRPLLAAGRLETALRVALTGAVTPYQVLDHLTTDVADAPADYVCALPGLIGAALDAWPGGNLTAPLHNCLEQLCDNEAADADATFELACEALRVALRAPEPTNARAGMIDAVSLFQAVEVLDSGRDDAAAYGAACRAVIAFVAGDFGAVISAAEELERILDRRQAWHLHAHLPQWRRPVREAETEWLALVLDLRAGAEHLTEPSWLDAAAAIGQLSRVYTAERASAPALGLTSILRPAIENAITANAVLIDQLSRSIDLGQSGAQPLHLSSANDLLAAIRRRGSGQAGVDDEETDPGHHQRIVRLAPELLRLGPATCRALAHLDDAELIHLGELIEQSDVIHVSVDPILARMRSGIVVTLEENPQFHGKTRAAVLYVLDKTLTFLRDRYNRGGPLLPNGSNTIKLLSELDRMPVEADLQYEFYIWLAASGPLAGHVSLEASDVSTGRVDITVRIAEINISTEVKRELRNSEPAALQQYVPQAAQYSGSTEPFSQLLVLDLTDHSSGARPLPDLAWAVQHRADPSASPQHVIVAVVIGNRPTPRQLTDRRKPSTRRK